MPQMSPMNWILLFFLFNISLYFMMVKMFFIFNKMLNTKEKSSFFSKKFLYKL